MQTLGSAWIAGAILALLADTAAARADLDDLEVTMAVVDDLDGLDSELEAVAERRGDFEASGDNRTDAAGAIAPDARRDEDHDAFMNDGLGEMNDADFEAQDDFAEGEDVDEDRFDALPGK